MAKWPYNTPRWKRLRMIVLRQEPFCRACRRAGELTPASQVDHIQEIRQGGAVWSISNLQPLCASCHSRKTNKSPDKRVDPDTGKPLDSSHWWNEKISQS